MNKRKIGLLMIYFLVISGFYSLQGLQTKEVLAKGINDNPLDTIIELDPNGNKLLGSDYEANRPVVRPAYQGDYSELFKDVTGPKGIFTGFYDRDNNNATFQHLQYFKLNDSLIYRNVGQYNNKKIALKVDFLGPRNATAGYQVGLMKDGSLYLNTKEDAPLLYQLVYDEAGFPPVPNILMDMPNEMFVGATGGGYAPTINMNYSNVNKVYLSIPEKWKGIPGMWGNTEYPVKRGYKLANESITNYQNVDLFQMEIDSSKMNIAISEFNILSDNNQKSLLFGRVVGNFTTYTTLFKTSIKTAYVPFYMPVRGNGVENSNKFEAKYDVGQAVIDAYAAYLPESLKIIAEDRQGYFENLQSTPDPIQFFEKDNVTRISGITTKAIGNKKLEITISKAVLQKLQTNQVNMKLNFSNLISSKVLGNYNSAKRIYEVPLTFYNIRTSKGMELKSEETVVNAEIIPNIYGEPNPVEVWIDSNSNDLNPKDLVKNGVTTIPGDTLKMSIEGYQLFNEAKTYNVSVKLASTKTPSLTKIIVVPVTVKRGNIITRPYFENQTWIIDEINRQLQKNIGLNVYESDLPKIKSIVLNKSYYGEHIPLTIQSLKNLEILDLTNVNLTGSLPNELGNLPKLNTLRVKGNTIYGTIPVSLANLSNLTSLDLSNNQLSSQIPTELTTLSKLNVLDVSANKLIWKIPEFRNQFITSNFSDNQITYDSATKPSFVKNGDYTFIANGDKTLQFVGKEAVFSEETKIKPFDSTNSGYFDLAVQNPKTGNKESLYPGHFYTIKDRSNGNVLYSGQASSAVLIDYRSDIEYEVTLDQTYNNPANKWIVKGKIPELKFEDVPDKLSLKTAVNEDERNTDLSIVGELAIFDNRDSGNKWSLKMKPSSLMEGSQKLEGEYVYIDSQGVEKPMVTDQSELIEQSQDSYGEVTPISAHWGGTQGLKYHLKAGNRIGIYQGMITWILEDAP